MKSFFLIFCHIWPLALAGSPLMGITSASARPQAAPVATTRSGTVLGTTAGGVDVFRGIPYAAAPVGELRWRAPQPEVAWKGVRTATVFGDDCLQDSARNPLPAGHAVSSSEDCLYLNVWRPAGTSSGDNLPVMVWIHGGAFIMGSGSMSIYDGTELARQGVIVVTLNYRLGRFGNFVTPALREEQARRGEPATNFWLMDQIAALRWVRGNVSAFGGNPKRITVFGESAGAVSVATLLAVPQARGLLAQAIMQSGSPRNALVSEKDAESAGLHWALTKGIPAGDTKALRRLRPEVVLDAPVTSVSEPVQDGTLLKEPPFATFAREGATPVRLLIGANDWEESLMRWLPNVGAALLARLGSKADEGLKLYDSGTLGERDALSRMWGDAAMVEPARETARMMAATGNQVWLYHFSYVPEAMRGKRPGAGHGDEIEFVFATPSPESKPEWTARDQAMAEAVSARWIAFARTGKPDLEGGVGWPVFSEKAGNLLEFSSNGEAVRSYFDKARLDFLRANALTGSVHKRNSP